MRIKIGIYDFFAHLISGGLLLATLLYVLQRLFRLPVSIPNIPYSQIWILGVIVYMMGFAMIPMGSLWYSCWVPEDMCQKAVSKLNQKLVGMGANLEIMDSYTLLAFVKRHSIDMARGVEQYYTISVILRSISLGFLLLSISFGVEFSFFGFSPGLIIFSFLCLFISIMLIQEAVKYHTCFFRRIYQSVVALIIKPEQLSIRFQERSILEHEPSVHE